MGYKKLYQFCQDLEPGARRWAIRDQVLKLTQHEKLPAVVSGLDTAICRGMYLSLRNTDHPFIKQNGCNVVVLARGLEKPWDRVIFLKETMHLFDDPIEATDSGDKFEQLLNDFSTSTSLASPSVAFQAELKCFWMAMGAICPEKFRQQILTERKNGTLNEYAVALKLRIPTNYVPRLYDPRFEKEIGKLTA